MVRNIVLLFLVSIQIIGCSSHVIQRDGEEEDLGLKKENIFQVLKRKLLFWHSLMNLHLRAKT